MKDGNNQKSMTFGKCNILKRPERYILTRTRTRTNYLPMRVSALEAAEFSDFELSQQNKVHLKIHKHLLCSVKKSNIWWVIFYVVLFSLVLVCKTRYNLNIKHNLTAYFYSTFITIIVCQI